MSRCVVKVTVATGDESNVVLATRLFCDGPSFKTSPSSTPASTLVENRLLDPGTAEWALFRNGGLFGAIDANAGTLMLNNADGALDAWGDAGVSGHPVELWYGDGDEFPAGYVRVWVLYGYQLEADTDAVTIDLRDRSYLLDQPVTFGRFAGTGGMEGDASVEGKPKQRIVGRAGLVPIRLLNQVDHLYHVSESYTNPQPGGPAEHFAVYEGGVLIDQQGDPMTGDFSAFESAIVDPGKCLFLFGQHDDSGDRGCIYLRLGSAPAGELRCTIFGSKYVFDLPQYQWQLHHFAQEAGITDAMPSDPPLLCGSRLLETGSETYRAFLNDACIPLCAFYGLNRFDAWFAGRFATPSDTPLRTFTAHNTIGQWDVQKPPGFPAPVAKIVGEFGETWPCQLQDEPDADVAEQLKRTGAFDKFVAENDDVREKHAFAPKRIVQARNGGARIYENPTTGDLDTFRPESFTVPYLSLFGRETVYATITVPFTAENLALNLLDTIRLQRDRIGLGAGENFRIVRVSIDAKMRQITIDGWNGAAAAWEPQS